VAEMCKQEISGELNIDTFVNRKELWRVNKFMYLRVCINFVVCQQSNALPSLTQMM
jgi:hypothetical protein